MRLPLFLKHKYGLAPKETELMELKEYGSVNK
jgi:hypothetical protein